MYTIKDLDKFKNLARELKAIEVEYKKDGFHEYSSAICIARVKLEMLIEDVTGCGRFNREIDSFLVFDGDLIENKNRKLGN